MRKIVEYKMAFGNSLDRLQGEVNDDIKHGFQPFGDVLSIPKEKVAWAEFAQPMVRYELVKP